MGTTGASACENIFMAEFEQKYIYPLTKEKSILFICYIEDIFMAWTKSEKQKIAKNQSKARQHPQVEPVLFGKYLLSSSTLSFKNNRNYSEKCAK